MASEAFAVVREGMEGMAGIGKVALYGREYLVKVQPRERGLIMYTLQARRRNPGDGRHRRARTDAGEGEGR